MRLLERAVIVLQLSRPVPRAVLTQSEVSYFTVPSSWRSVATLTIPAVS